MLVPRLLRPTVALPRPWMLPGRHAPAMAMSCDALMGLDFRKNYGCALTMRRLSSDAKSDGDPGRADRGATPRDDLYRDQNATWADRHLAESILPYAKLMRLDRPIGTYLLMFPGWWSIALAAPNGSLPDIKYIGLFGAGALIMRGAGCTINDYWDREMDGKVARTSQRPIASGKVSETQALLFLTAQGLAGLGILVQLNLFSIGLGAASIIPVALYPLAKRYVSWPQAVLGLTINWGALLGWAAVHGSLDYSVVLPLYLGSAFWTLFYDTIYAHQDKDDDRKIGIKSSALTIGDENTKPVLAAFGVATIGLWGVAGHHAGLGDSLLFHTGLASSAAHLTWQLYTSSLNDRINLTNRFVSNQYVGALMFMGIVSGKYLYL